MPASDQEIAGEISGGRTAQATLHIAERHMLAAERQAKALEELVKMLPPPVLIADGAREIDIADIKPGAIIPVPRSATERSADALLSIAVTLEMLAEQQVKLIAMAELASPPSEVKSGGNGGE